MLPLLKRVSLAVMLACAWSSASAFSMLGPYASWQVERIGYALPGDIGGPMNLGEEYRWNVKTVYYAYDESFVSYFGSQGTNAIEKTITILNAIPAVSQMSQNLTEFPLSTRRRNQTASALNLVDMKSVTLTAMMQQLGLASPERYVWCLYDRVELSNPDRTNYTVIKRNFDPVTLQPSSYVNGVLYTYQIGEFQNPDFADAVEVRVDPLASGFTAVASGWDGLFGGLISSGDYYTGLTRDDMGGLRRLYNPNLYHVETLLPGTTTNTTSGGGPWGVPGGTNTTTNLPPIDVAIRPGVDKINYVRGHYDSLIGSFVTITNVWTDKYVTNSTLKSQSVQRVLTTPDILFAADDLGTSPQGVPLYFGRSGLENWINNDEINGSTTLAGPGVIQGPVVFRYSTLGPSFINQFPAFMDESLVLTEGVIWGDFDGTTNAPVVFPSGSSIYDLQLQVLYGGSGGGGEPWSIPDSFSQTTNGATGDGTQP